VTLIKPSENFCEEIEPALAEYLKDPRCKRLANNLARAVDHHLTWTYEYYTEVNPTRLAGSSNEKEFRRQLISQCPELRMMNDLSDAAHHRFLTRRSDPPRITSASTAAYSVEAGELYVTDYKAPFGPAALKSVDFWRRWKD
jgi:hypothetical protein